MKPAPFEYFVAESIEHALALKHEYGDDARFLAGGQSLVPAMNFRLAQPTVLIDLNRIAGFGALRHADETLSLGALVRHRDLERHPLAARHAPLFAEAAPHVAHPQVRNRGTLGGNLAQADPASEFPACAVAHRAHLRLRSARGERTVAANDFFVGVFATRLGPDELLVGIEVPAPPAHTGTAFMEIARRRGDYAIVGVATQVSLDAAGRCVDASVVLCGAGETPVALEGPAKVLAGERGTEDALHAAAASFDGEIDPPSNVHATAAYRRHLAGVLVRRALALAFGRARAAA